MMKKATREQTKLHNSRLVLKTIYERDLISRADIARTTGLTRTTVSDLVEEFIESSLVYEKGFGPSIGGKRPTLLAFNKNAYVIVGLDLSDPDFCGALINLRGEVLTKIYQPLDRCTGKEVIDLVISITRRLIAQSSQPILGIRVGCQGVFNPENGTVVQAVRLSWQDVPLKKLLEDQFSLPVVVSNDSHAGALAEYAFGQNGNASSLILLKVSGGISAGILLKGQLQHGESYGAGEIGHMVAIPGGDHCHCGHFGCLETVASSQALIKEARRIFQEFPETSLRRMVANPSHLTFEHVFTAFQEGDPQIVKAVERAGEYLGRSLAAVVCLLDVEHIYLAGMLSVFGEPLINIIRQNVLTQCLETLAQKTHVEVCARSEEIAMLGGAAVLLREKLGVI